MKTIALIQGITAVAAIVLTVVAVTKNYMPCTHNYVYLCMAVSVFSVGSFFETLAVSQGALFAVPVGTLGAAFIGPAWFLLYCTMYTKQSYLFKQKGLPVLFLSFLVLFAEYTMTALYLKEGEFSSGRYFRWMAPGGRFDQIYAALTLALCLACCVIVAVLTGRGRVQASADNRIMMAASGLPALVLGLGLLGVPYAYPLRPVVMLVSLLLILAVLQRQRAQYWMPLIRGSLMEGLSDALVLMDTEGRYVDANPKALAYFRDLAETPHGARLRDVTGFPREVLELEGGETEIVYPCHDVIRYFRASVSSIISQENKSYKCVIFYDVTQIHNLVTELSEQAHMDGLTGLLNRGTFFQYASRDFALAKRNGKDISLLMLDIDHFKEVNDLYGHQVGDEVLQGIAAVMKYRLRATDLVGRYGGEEFCVFLPDTNIRAAGELAEQLRRDVGGRCYTSHDGRCFIVTISVGISSMLVGTYDTLEELVEDADMGLYAAKRSGRNKVMPYTDDVRRAGNIG